MISKEATVTILVPTYAKILKEHGTLSDVLDSLKKLKDDNFRVIVLDTTDPLDTEVEEKIEEAVDNYNQFFPIMHVNVLDLWKIHEFMENNRFGSLVEVTNLRTYAGFRNVGLIIAHILKSKLVLMVDDDETIKQTDFIQRARDGINTLFRGKPILGKSGYMIYNGDHKLKQKGGKRKELWPNAEMMNKTVGKLIRTKHRYNVTPIGFGGCMVLTSKLFSKVPFDPYCQRGEDANFVMSCRHLGYTFVFDNRMKLNHHQPKIKPKGGVAGGSFYLRFRQDIYRFIYERARMDYFDMDPEDFDPFPGFFLKDDLEYRAANVSINYANRAAKNKKKEFLKGHMENLKILFKDAPEYAAMNAPKYTTFQRRWARFMLAVKQDKELFEHFNRF